MPSTVTVLERRKTVMTIVAVIYQYVIGVDTHARTRTYAILNPQTGARTGAESFPVTTPGINRAVAWIRRNTHGVILAAVEGTNSYGASLWRALTAENIPVVEAKPPKKQARSSRKIRCHSCGSGGDECAWP